MGYASWRAATIARLEADSRVVAPARGPIECAEVGRGPARSQPSRQRYDAYDVAPYLVAGTNVVAVLVTYYGEATSFWQPAPAGSSSDAVLVFEDLQWADDGLLEYIEHMLDWVAQWVGAGKPLLGKPTHFETRDGAF